MDPPEQQRQQEQEYKEFIKITRKHQAERERLKKLELKKNPPIEEYYIDISQVSTLILDNLVDAPERRDDANDTPSGRESQDNKLIRFYGCRDSFERIRSMEMHLDEHFKNKCRALKPHYWPVIPINPKPYLNPIRN